MNCSAQGQTSIRKQCRTFKSVCSLTKSFFLYNQWSSAHARRLRLAAVVLDLQKISTIETRNSTSGELWYFHVYVYFVVSLKNSLNKAFCSDEKTELEMYASVWGLWCNHGKDHCIDQTEEIYVMTLKWLVQKFTWYFMREVQLKASEARVVFLFNPLIWLFFIIWQSHSTKILDVFDLCMFQLPVLPASFTSVNWPQPPSMCPGASPPSLTASLRATVWSMNPPHL